MLRFLKLLVISAFWFLGMGRHFLPSKGSTPVFRSYPLAGSPNGVLGSHPMATCWSEQNMGFLDMRAPSGYAADESAVPGPSGGLRCSRKQRDLGKPISSASDEESSKLVSSSCGNEFAGSGKIIERMKLLQNMIPGYNKTNSEAKRLQLVLGRDANGDSRFEREANSQICNRSRGQSVEPSKSPKHDFIYVRARRGQATDRHSLAERARREKISQLMKILQDMVPGCNKIVGKASILEAIINYVQSLQWHIKLLLMENEDLKSTMSADIEAQQRQVEILSMTIEDLRSTMNNDIEALPG